MVFENYHLSDRANIITKEVPGKNSQTLLKKQDQLEGNNRSYPRAIPIALERARGAIIEDVDGNHYIDFFAGCGVLNLGHNNPGVLADMVRQQEKLIQALDFPTKVKIKFMEKLNAVLPGELQGEVKINFCGPTGADAVEAALKIARINTRRPSIISFQGAYHGMTGSALSTTAHLYHRKQLPGPGSGVHFMPYCYCYRCAFGKKPDTCMLECAQYIRETLENPCSGIEKPAAIIIEPVQGEGGTIVPRQGFLEAVTQIAHDFDILVIFDEIQSGFYRTGPFLSFQQGKAVPDLITLSKGLGGIGMPIAVTVYRKHLDTWEKGTHAGTFRGNQLSIAAAASALEFAERFHIEEYTRKTGENILENLKHLQKKSRFIGDVRGCGLMLGIEYVKDRKTKTPFPEIASELQKRFCQNGLLVEVGGHYANVIRLLPPLVITENIAQNALEIFERLNSEVEKETS